VQFDVLQRGPSDAIQYPNARSALSGWNGLLNLNSKVSADNFNVRQFYDTKAESLTIQEH
jgi:hypothetical protein